MRYIFYLMGKSASGKDTLYEKLLASGEPALDRMVLWTTRPVRSGEQDGVTYHFTDVEHMKDLERRGKIIEHREYQTVYGPWHYFTAEEEDTEDDSRDLLGIGTLESYARLRDWYGEDRVIPLYIEVEDGLRLQRALNREKAQAQPRYEEMCRRFLADQEDFSEEKLLEAGIRRRYENNGEPEECLAALRGSIMEVLRKDHEL